MDTLKNSDGNHNNSEIQANLLPVVVTPSTPVKKSIFKIRFWNIMFLVLMYLGGIVSHFIRYQLGAGLQDLVIIFTFGYFAVKITRKFSDVRYNSEENKFYDSNNVVIDYDRLKLMPLVLLLNAFVMVYLYIYINKIWLLNFISLASCVVLPFLVLTIYLTYKNCPVTIIFFLRAWTPQVFGIVIQGSSYRSSSSSSEVSSYVNSPTFYNNYYR